MTAPEGGGAAMTAAGGVLRGLGVLSFGGGVNSTAMLLRLVRENRAPDRVIFADTGEEDPRTYSYIEARVKPFCAEHEIPFDVVRSHYGRLVDYYTRARAVPSIQRRDCTTKFKVDPIRRFLRSLGVRKATVLLGIAADEAHRMHDSPRKWITHEYPLVDWRMNRAACEAEIAAHGWPSPGKSGCRGCPFSGERGLARLLRDDPADFARWRRMEEGSTRFPALLLLNRPPRLAWIEREARTRRPLESFAEGSGECLPGACAIDQPQQEEPR